MTKQRRFIHPLLLLTALLCLLAPLLYAVPTDYFQIMVVDADTGRGVPPVELKTVNVEQFHTDSNGVVALNEPDLMGRAAWFGVKSRGYEYPADGFASRGAAVEVKAGGSARVRIKRLNIAERLYPIWRNPSTVLALDTAARAAP